MRIETYVMPNASDVNTGKPLTLWVKYERNGKEVKFTIYGSYNPLPFKTMIVCPEEATRLKKWIEDFGWVYIGIHR